ncbi:unnamed protein product [Durusdinium trenchii]|uniref:Carrier domain-containing protein n=1 Tax=Durusdinium trenchii TaxID=1381693 RepID=A0ABP0I283_9DINO
MGQLTQEARLRFRNARRDLKYDRINAALDEATQAYASFQLSGDLDGMAECVRIVSHALGRQGLRKQAVQMATEELEKFREKNQKRAEALMLVTLAEIKLNANQKESREEACHLANQARLAFTNLKDRKMEGESCLASGNALLKCGAFDFALEAFQQARPIFKSLQQVSLEGRALHGLACCHAAGGLYTRAVEQAKEACKCFETSQSSIFQTAVLEAISSWYVECGELQLARSFAEQSLAMAQEASSPRREASALRSLVKVYILQGDANSVLGNCLDAVSRYRDMNAREAESIALAALVECSIASQGSLDRSLQAATDACIAFREMGDAHQEMHMCCTMARLCLEHQQLDQAESHARTALQLARGLDDRLGHGEALGLLAQAFMTKDDGSEKALVLLKKEQVVCQDAKDQLGEALCSLSLAHVYMELSKPKEVLASADAASRLFRSIGDKMGELSALQITADVHARAMRYAEMSSALEKALTLAEALGDVVTEASLNISLAQAQMGLLEVSSMQPKSDTFQMQGALAAKAAKRAVALARRQQRSDLIISALCALSQTQFLVGEKQAARSAAKAAASLAKGQPLTEATALVLAANSCIAMGKTDAAKEAASNALYLFEEVKDYVGQDLAKATLDAIDNPVSAVSISGKMRLVRKRKTSVNAEALRQKVRNVVSEIVGMDALMDDTPLMQSGLTSQSAVLLRNALSNEIPGPSLPFTLMFDYPSITDLSAFFVESAGGEEEEVEEWVEDTSAAGARKAQARSGPSPDELRKQVRDVVAEIVGMDDLVDDTPLMQAGLTSQSAVLLRNSLSKELPGASLPFTMMFDYPSINALTEFFVARSGPQVDMDMIEDEDEGAPMMRSSLDPQVTQRQVRQIVEDIVGMDDFADDAALMQHGITSHNAVLLRDALSKEFQGPNMPHTLIFDYPSVLDLTEYIMVRAQK